MTPERRLELYEDSDGRFHYQHRPMGVKDAKHTPMLCGRLVTGMRAAAWFDVGDERGLVHYTRGCDECVEILSY